MRIFTLIVSLICMAFAATAAKADKRVVTGRFGKAAA